jgi:hypothetical protein
MLKAVLMTVLLRDRDVETMPQMLQWRRSKTGVETG